MSIPMRKTFQETFTIKLDAMTGVVSGRRKTSMIKHHLISPILKPLMSKYFFIALYLRALHTSASARNHRSSLCGIVASPHKGRGMPSLIEHGVRSLLRVVRDRYVRCMLRSAEPVAGNWTARRPCCSVLHAVAGIRAGRCVRWVVALSRDSFD